MNQATPIYQQLIDNIKQKIVNGELKVGNRLPSERDMAEKYGINRMTIRNAIKKMVAEGTLTSKRGSGTYVASYPSIESKLELANNGHLSLSAQIRQKGMKSSRKTLLLRKIHPEGETKDYFPNESYIYEITRLSLINDEPYAFQIVHIPFSKFKDADRFNFETFSLYEYMDDQGHRPTTMITYLSIESLPKEFLEIMNIKENQKIFHFDYFGFDDDHAMVEFTKSYHLPKYTSFHYVTNRGNDKSK